MRIANNGIVDTSTYNIMINARGIAVVSSNMTEDIIYSGKVKISSGILENNPSAIASERDLALRELVEIVLAVRRGMNNSVVLPRR